MAKRASRQGKGLEQPPMLLLKRQLPLGEHFPSSLCWKLSANHLLPFKTVHTRKSFDLGDWKSLKMENSSLITGARWGTAGTNTLETYTEPHCNLPWSSDKMKIPKVVDGLIFQYPRAWFALYVGHLRICSLCCNPVWWVPTSLRAVTLAASETPTVTAACAKSACMPVPSQRTEQHMESLGSRPSVRSGQDSACNSDLRQCSGDNDSHSKGSAGLR